MCIKPAALASVWYSVHAVSERDKAVIIRIIPAGTNRPITYQSEFTILRLLRQRGCSVPRPLLNYAESPDHLTDISEPWAVTEAINGQALGKKVMPPQIASEMGRQIAILHSLPTRGYGRLAEQKDQLQGLQSDHLTGICARWCWADIWPFDGSNLGHHPIAQTDLHLVDQLEHLAPRFLEIINDDQIILNHSDLHGAHIFLQDGELAGLIDFGVSFMSIPAWEFAVLAYYHGWPVVQQILIGYNPSREVQELHYKKAQDLAVVVGLYKLAKVYAGPASNEKVVGIRNFIAQTLNALNPTT